VFQTETRVVADETSTMPSPLPAGDDGPGLSFRGLNWKPAISKRMRARMETIRMQMRMRRKKRPKPMMHQHRMWKIDGIVGDDDRYECDDADADEME
jgi:hypothetical protein